MIDKPASRIASRNCFNVLESWYCTNSPRNIMNLKCVRAQTTHNWTLTFSIPLPDFIKIIWDVSLSLGLDTNWYQNNLFFLLFSPSLQRKIIKKTCMTAMQENKKQNLHRPVSSSAWMLINKCLQTGNIMSRFHQNNYISCPLGDTACTPGKKRNSFKGHPPDSDHVSQCSAVWHIRTRPLFFPAETCVCQLETFQTIWQPA